MFGIHYCKDGSVGVADFLGSRFEENNGGVNDMKTKVLINGKAVDAVLDDEQVKAALDASQKHTGLEHPGYDGVIYNLDGGQYTDNSRDILTPREFSDKHLRDDYARAMDIYRRLVEAAAMLNSVPVEKFDGALFKYYLYLDNFDEELRWDSISSMYDTAVLFESKEAAQKAIDIVGEDDLIWLFRDFQPYIGAYKTEE